MAQNGLRERACSRPLLHENASQADRDPGAETRSCSLSVLRDSAQRADCGKDAQRLRCLSTYNSRAPCLGSGLPGNRRRVRCVDYNLDVVIQGQT